MLPLFSPSKMTRNDGSSESDSEERRGQVNTIIQLNSPPQVQGPGCKQHAYQTIHQSIKLRLLIILQLKFQLAFYQRTYLSFSYLQDLLTIFQNHYCLKIKFWDKLSI